MLTKGKGLFYPSLVALHVCYYEYLTFYCTVQHFQICQRQPFAIVEKVKIFFSHSNKSLIVDFIVAYGSEIQHTNWPIFSQFSQLFTLVIKFNNCPVMFESHSKGNNFVTCKELGYGPTINVLLKRSHYLNIGFASWFDLKVILWINWN